MAAINKVLSGCNACFKVFVRIPLRIGNASYCTTAINSATGEDDGSADGQKMSKAMKAYLERSRKYNEFIKHEENTFNIGKRHLANMMGCDPETFTQEQIDDAIAYLFPSGLFEKKARPFMKPPHLVFPPRKDAEFDESGRPFHFLFYTGKPNLYNVLHECVGNLIHLNNIEDKIIRNRSVMEVQGELNLTGTEWLSKEELEKNLVETLSIEEYNNFILAMDRLASHKHAAVIKDFLLKNRKRLLEISTTFAPTEPEMDRDGRRFILTKDCPRKTARADVKVISPGTGLISVNGKGIDYFSSMQCRNQILFPLELTGQLESVDVEATVKGGGETGQAGAIRWGISWGLRCFVSPDMFETMRLAGLLTRDFRRKERKKPGQEGARRKFTWKKR